MAAHATGPELAATRRTRDEGPGGAARAERRRASGDPGAPALPSRADAAVDPDQGIRRRGRLEHVACDRCRAVSARFGCQVAGRRGGPRQSRGDRGGDDLDRPGEPPRPDTSAAATAPAGNESTAMSML